MGIHCSIAYVYMVVCHWYVHVHVHSCLSATILSVLVLGGEPFITFKWDCELTHIPYVVQGTVTRVLFYPETNKVTFTVAHVAGGYPRLTLDVLACLLEELHVIDSYEVM